MDLKRHSRRDFIRLTGLSVAGVAIAACAGEPEVVEKIVKETVIVEKEVEKEVTVLVEKEIEAEPEATSVPEALPSKYKEAPMLAELAAKGELPPVDERLPEEPLVVEVIDQIGQYGGTIVTGSLFSTLIGGDADKVSIAELLLRLSPNLQRPVPNLLKAWEISEDYQEITCHLRRGVRWSDGEPLTMDDFEFWYNEVLLNPEITPLISADLRPGGEVMQFTRLDDYNYKLTFAGPTPAFPLVRMAHQYGFGITAGCAPAHYMKQFHIAYNPDAGKLAEEAGFDFWYQYFGRQNDPLQNAERPDIRAFMPVNETPGKVFFERNPYFWMVDPEGNQLPYIDKLLHDQVADLSMYNAKIVGGEYDFAGFDTNIQYYATYADAGEQGGYHLILWNSGKGSEVVYTLNMNWPEDEWREVFSDDRFRQALSLAINRSEINQVIYFGNAKERQMTVIEASRHFRPEYAAAFAEYDPDRANALLDEMGLEWNAAGTHRLWPVSKQPIILPFDFYESETPKGPITELVGEYWGKIGIEIKLKSITRTLLAQKRQANELPIGLWHGDATTDVLFMRWPKWFAPDDKDAMVWGIHWARWYLTGGEVGEEPPEVIKQQYIWMDEYNATDSDEAAANILKSQMEHIWIIGTVGEAPHPLVCRDNLKNISQMGFWVWDSLWTWPVFPEQWYIEQS